MTLWCQRSRTCTKQTGTSMRRLREAGLRSMPWASGAVLPNPQRRDRDMKKGSFSLWFFIVLKYGIELQVCNCKIEIEKETCPPSILLCFHFLWGLYLCVSCVFTL
ncbi:hypothetical protein M8C21_015770 [Ambrosia artemisiifolia]|uniref:Uncharacterized protein n=1 Tax=Ambrosia artemisiifolia TaxID=4212 RepID=A0AAD5CWQ8_AMBAR|nr:hypothetical protein M8C21_015770 [Ambrosia artemisiifolia]